MSIRSSQTQEQNTCSNENLDTIGPSSRFGNNNINNSINNNTNNNLNNAEPSFPDFKNANNIEIYINNISNFRNNNTDHVNHRVEEQNINYDLFYQELLEQDLLHQSFIGQNLIVSYLKFKFMINVEIMFLITQQIINTQNMIH